MKLDDQLLNNNTGTLQVSQLLKVGLFSYRNLNQVYAFQNHLVIVHHACAPKRARLTSLFDVNVFAVLMILLSKSLIPNSVHMSDCYDAFPVLDYAIAILVIINLFRSL